MEYMNSFMPFAGDRMSILPWILIGVAVLGLAAFFIWKAIENKKDD